MIKDDTEVSKAFTVKNEKGLHTRPATEIVQCLRNYSSDVFFTYNGTKSDAKSVLGLLMLAAPFQAEVKVSAKGEDALAAVDAIIHLANAKFNVSY
ncbi:phosphocarrier protein HPr [Candidatus Aerophobetes bacterium]|uniref:Phosphocarrier protein HPr n=1 Tax=Aerophobetes bacterium TaxID=2030807 RepID=A0A2A4X7V2_UNCAE|nr:MAG: phosphocarrier protein HPr [Candidatus Aerophobetes bacterium]